MHFFEEYKQRYQELKRKEQRRLVSFFRTVLLFVVAYTVFTPIRYWYTEKYFAYQLLISDGFVQYLPYALFFVFLYVYREKVFDWATRFRFSWGQFFSFGVLAVLLLFVPTKPFLGKNDIDLIFSEYGVLLLANMALFFAFFGKQFVKIFWNQLILLLLLLIPFKLAPILIDAFWEYSSAITLVGLKMYLELFNMEYVMEAEKFRVQIQDFDAYIGPSCAGIHSLLAFFVLFMTAVLLAYEKGARFYRARLLLSIISGLILIFFVNSLRVLLILLVGVYYSKEFAITIFHDNAGAIVLIGFFVLYLSFVWKRIIQRK